MVRDVLSQVLALEQLHGDPRDAGRLVDAGADHLDHVIAGDARADPCLLHEALALCGVGDQLRVHQLERPALAGAELLGHVDRAHAARSEQREHAEVSSDHRVRGQRRRAHHW